MNNEEKAQEISEKNKQFHVECSSLECYLSSLEMAKWKDEQLESKLMQIIILAQQGYTSGSTDEMILKQCKEVIQENMCEERL